MQKSFRVRVDSAACGVQRPATMLALKRLTGVIPEVNLRENTSCPPPPSVNKGAHAGFEKQTRCHQKLKTGVSVVP